MPIEGKWENQVPTIEGQYYRRERIPTLEFDIAPTHLVTVKKLGGVLFWREEASTT